MPDSGNHGEDPLQKALRLVLAMLPPASDAAPGEVIAACDGVHAMLSGEGEPVDLATLRREAGNASPSGRKPRPGWRTQPITSNGFPRREATRTGTFWDRYRRYLGEVKLMPRQRRMAHSTRPPTGCSASLKIRHEPGRWRRDGLVAGHVQSGKTANYIGLICKAADAGYKLIVVLAGIDNSLRSQTQLRVDEGFLGFDTQYQQRYDEDRARPTRCRRHARARHGSTSPP